MQKFSALLAESRTKTIDITPETLKEYIDKFSRALPVHVRKALDLIQKCSLLTKGDIESVRTASQRKLNKMADDLNLSIGDLTDLKDILGLLKKDIIYIPQYQAADHFKWLMDGKMRLEDLTIDLKSPAGRNEVAKRYMPLVHSIANKYVGQSKLDRNELISAGLEGLVMAMDKFKPVDGDSDEKTVSFKTFAGYMIRNYITAEMTQSNTLSGANWYNTAKYGYAMFNALSLDNFGRGGGDDEFDQDHLKALGVEDEEPKQYSKEGKMWDELYKALEKKFSQRDVDVFYRFFGVNGRKREKSKDIAKSYGMSQGNIRNSILNKMLRWIKENPQVADIISDLRDLYTEALMLDSYSYGKSFVLETLSGDDTYILLNEMTRWDDPRVFLPMVDGALKMSDKIIPKILDGDFNTIDQNLKKNKMQIVKFLTIMYPAEDFRRKSDVDLLQLMSDVQSAWKEHKK